jgi:hypothetical protein
MPTHIKFCETSSSEEDELDIDNLMMAELDETVPMKEPEPETPLREPPREEQESQASSSSQSRKRKKRKKNKGSTEGVNPPAGNSNVGASVESIAEVTGEMLLHHDSAALRQGALKEVLRRFIVETKLTHSDVKKVAKELLPPPPVRFISTPDTKRSAIPRGKEKAKAQPAAKSERVKRRKQLLADLKRDVQTYPLDQRGNDSAYADKVREIRAQFRAS